MILALALALVLAAAWFVVLALSAPHDPPYSDLRHRPLAGPDDRCRRCGHRLDEREHHPSWWRRVL